MGTELGDWVQLVAVPGTPGSLAGMVNDVAPALCESRWVGREMTKVLAAAVASVPGKLAERVGDDAVLLGTAERVCDTAIALMWLP